MYLNTRKSTGWGLQKIKADNLRDGVLLREIHLSGHKFHYSLNRSAIIRRRNGGLRRRSMMSNSVQPFLIAFLAFCGASSVLLAQGSQFDPEVYSQLKYRYIGPVGNRATSVAGIPGNPNVYYVGAASGGIFKSTDGGIHWDPIFDDEPISSIGSLAVAASDPNTVWAGTGESFIRSHISVGNGIYKSLDAGKTWKLMGLEKTGRIANVIIDPHNPDIVLACALGHAYGPQPDRGVFRTTDGGKSWEKVLFVDENTGCSDMG